MRVAREEVRKRCEKQLHEPLFPNAHPMFGLPLNRCSSDDLNILDSLRKYVAEHSDYLFLMMQGIEPAKLGFMYDVSTGHEGSKAVFGVKRLMTEKQFHTQYHFDIKTFDEANDMVIYMMAIAQGLCEEFSVEYPPSKSFLRQPDRVEFLNRRAIPAIDVINRKYEKK